MRYNLSEYERVPQQAVVLSDSVYHSYLGKYFLGQTGIFSFGGGYYAWGGLINPKNSGVNMFLNAYTVSNFSNKPFTAEGWLGGNLPGIPKTSNLFAAGNQAMTPPSIPYVKIEYSEHVTSLPEEGTYTFTRRVEPEQTLTKHDFQGMYIIPPGSSFVLFMINADMSLTPVSLAFGWWEEPIYC